MKTEQTSVFDRLPTAEEIRRELERNVRHKRQLRQLLQVVEFARGKKR